MYIRNRTRTSATEYVSYVSTSQLVVLYFSSHGQPSKLVALHGVKMASARQGATHSRRARNVLCSTEFIVTVDLLYNDSLSNDPSAVPSERGEDAQRAKT